MYSTDSKKFTLMFQNQNQTGGQNDNSVSRAGPVKATLAAVEGSAGKVSKNVPYNITNVQEKKVSEIAKCLEMN